MKKVLLTIIAALLSLVVIFNCYSMISRLVTDTQYPRLFGFGSATVVSGSMSPAIHVEDVVVTLPQATYHKGDIVTIKGEQYPTTHRVVAVTNKTITTKGDANNTADIPTSKKDIYGKVVVIIPKLGYVTSFLKQPMGLFILIGSMTLLWTIDDFRAWRLNRQATFGKGVAK
jgi:signal peptidase